MSLRALFAEYLEAKRRSLRGLGSDESDPDFDLGPELPEYLRLYNTALKLAQDAEEFRNTELKIAAITQAIEILTRIGMGMNVSGKSGQAAAIRAKVDFLTKRRASFKTFGKTAPEMSVVNQRMALQMLLNNYERQALLFKTGKAKIANRATVERLIKQALEERKRKSLELLKESNPFMTDEEEQTYLKRTFFTMSEDEKKQFRFGADIRLLRSMENTIEQEIQKMSQIDSDEGDRFKSLFDAIRHRLF